MLGTARPHLADHAISDGLWGHVGDSAGRGGGNFALNVHLARHAKVGHLGREAVGHRGRGRQQDVACSGHSAVSGGAPQAMTARL